MKRTLATTGLLAAALLSTAGAVTAQTTHVVTLSGLTFSPQDICIEVGDTVQWDWIDGIHNVESGVLGTPDGNFTSGAPTGPPNSFSLTFDAAFLAANPMVNDLYAYYCLPHWSFGMVGSVKVGVAASATFRNDSGGTNLATYLNVTPPVLGGTWSSTIDVSSHLGAVGALIVGYNTPLEFPSSFGWILVNIADPNGQLVNITSFGAGTVPFNVPVPSDPMLCGFPVSTQGVVIGGGFELTNAQDIVLGA